MQPPAVSAGSRCACLSVFISCVLTWDDPRRAAEADWSQRRADNRETRTRSSAVIYELIIFVEEIICTGCFSPFQSAFTFRRLSGLYEEWEGEHPGSCLTETEEGIPSDRLSECWKNSVESWDSLKNSCLLLTRLIPQHEKDAGSYQPHRHTAENRLWWWETKE